MTAEKYRRPYDIAPVPAVITYLVVSGLVIAVFAVFVVQDQELDLMHVALAAIAIVGGALSGLVVIMFGFVLMGVAGVPHDAVEWDSSRGRWQMSMTILLLFVLLGLGFGLGVSINDDPARWWIPSAMLVPPHVSAVLQVWSPKLRWWAGG